MAKLVDGRLENWSIIWKKSPHDAPEKDGLTVLHAEVYESKAFEDGEVATTQELVSLDLEKGLAKTLNAKFKLGQPSYQWLDYLDKNSYSIEDYAVCLEKNRAKRAEEFFKDYFSMN